MRTGMRIAAALMLAGAAFAAELQGVTVPPGTADAVTIPQRINFQGKLTDASGNPRNGSFDIAFKLYDGVSPYWNETQTGVQVTDGLFSVQLGAVTAIPSIPDAGACSLEVTVAGEAMVPKIPLVSVPYAYYASNAGDDGDWTRADPPDSVLYTVHELGIARGGAGNALHGSYSHTHTNLGVGSTTGMPGYDRQYCTVGGGQDNHAGGSEATVGGGTGNNANGERATVGGGSGNGASELAATVGGGLTNTASAQYAAVGGGTGNGACATSATVAGGYWNAAWGLHSTVAGGNSNYAGVADATVGGGSDNNATGVGATVAGGSENNATHTCATVGGGLENFADDLYATVPGGFADTALGNCGFAAGRHAVAGSGSFVWGDISTMDRIASTASNQWRARCAGGVYFFTNAGMTSGSYMAAGGNSWIGVSDSAVKENFRPVDSRALLERVARVRVREYNLKSQSPAVKHIGPVAQEFHGAFGYGETDRGINMQDADGVALAAIQALYEELQDRDARIEALEARLAELEAR